MHCRPQSGPLGVRGQTGGVWLFFEGRGPAGGKWGLHLKGAHSSPNTTSIPSPTAWGPWVPLSSDIQAVCPGLLERARGSSGHQGVHQVKTGTRQGCSSPATSHLTLCPLHQAQGLITAGAPDRLDLDQWIHPSLHLPSTLQRRQMAPFHSGGN